MANLVGTLAKVAVGAMLARGVGKMVSGNRGATNNASGLGGLLGGLLGGQQRGGGGLLGNLGAMLGGQQQGGGLGSLLDNLGAQSHAAPSGGGSLGSLLNSALSGQTNEVHSTPEQDAQAEILIKAMIGAAKCDGHLDEKEQQRILGRVDDSSGAEMNFLRNQMNAPFDLNSFIREVPSGMEQQVYLMSLMAIDLDAEAEIQYLDKLRRGLQMTEQQCNAIHQQLGVPALYH